MVLLQPKLHLKVSQRQILTPGLVQMVSVLALNKLELRDMITAEMVENPVLEELEDSVPLLDDVNRREEERPTTPEENQSPPSRRKIHSKKSTSAHFFRIISIPAIAARERWKRSSGPPSKTFFPNQVLWLITSCGN